MTTTSKPSVHTTPCVDTGFVSDEQLLAALDKLNPQIVELEFDAHGNVIVDKNAHPDIYDWVVHG